MQWRWFVLIGCLLPALAGAKVLVSPSSAELNAERREASFAITNDSDEALDVRLEVVPWTPQGYDTDVDEAEILRNKALLVYPPVARVESNNRQVFRVILRDRSIRELALFRLLISWRSSRKADIPDREEGKLNFGLGYSLPLMVTAPGAEHRLRYRAVMYGDQLALELVNLGNRPVYVKRYRWADGSENALFAYAWPGAKRYFPLPTKGPPPITVQLRTWGWTPSEQRTDDGDAS